MQKSVITVVGERHDRHNCQSVFIPGGIEYKHPEL